MKKKIYCIAYLVFLCITLISCTQEQLIMPSSTVNSQVNVRPIARPEKIVVFSDFNRKMEVYWPILSDRIKSAKINYADISGPKEVLVNRFDTPTVLEMEAVAEYEYSITYFGTEDVASSSSKFSGLSKDYEVNIKADAVQIKDYEGGGLLVFPATTAKSFTYIVHYEDEGLQKVKEITSEELEESVLIANLSDKDKSYELKVLVKDNVLGISSEKIIYRMKPGRYVNELIAENIEIIKSYDKAELKWENIQQSAVQIVLKYQYKGQSKVLEIKDNSELKGKLEFDVDNGLTNVTVEITGLSGKVSIVPKKVEVMKLNFNNAVLRAGWTPYASHTGSDGNNQKENSARFLIDGSTDTWWHNDWIVMYYIGNPTLDFPYTLNLSFTKQRVASASNLFNEPALLAPVGAHDLILVKEITFVHRPNNLIRTNNVRLFGIKENNEVVHLGDHVTTQGNSGSVPATSVFDLSSNVEKFKAVRMILVDPSAANSEHFCHMAEIYLKGYLKN